jgi:hypothetical protein
MTTVRTPPVKSLETTDQAGVNTGEVDGRLVWVTALIAALAVGWPTLLAAIVNPKQVLFRVLAGDSYHYLAIARKAHEFGIFTYDGVHVTNGFHPLWQYSIRAIFAVLHLQSHESQALAVIWLSWTSTVLGVLLASAAIVRITGKWFLGLLVVPGVYYLIVGVHVRNLWIWSSLDGMEAAYSTLWGGLLFYVLSRYIRKGSSVADASRAAGIVFPLVILSRLDDVFILPAFVGALMLVDISWQQRIKSAAWLTLPSCFALSIYLLYNRATVGAAMPLSGSTKAGFVGATEAYLTMAVHMPIILNIKDYLTHTSSNGSAIFSNSFRFVELLYPLLTASFGAYFLYKRRRWSPAYSILFAICAYIILKTGFNFLNVHPWHQSDWYYALVTLSLSVLGAFLSREWWSHIQQKPILRNGIVTVYVLLMLLSASQFYASLVYPAIPPPEDSFWTRAPDIRQQLQLKGCHGIINVDDGISAFLLDLPSMHGFAFATDVQAQRAFKAGRMLSLAYSRGINTITGFGYLATDSPPLTDAAIRSYLLSSNLSRQVILNDEKDYDFSLAYYDPVLKMPFFLFAPKAIVKQ